MIVEIEMDDMVTFYTGTTIHTRPAQLKSAAYVVQVDSKPAFTVPTGGIIVVRTDHGKPLRTLGLKPAKDHTGEFNVKQLLAHEEKIMALIRLGSTVSFGSGYRSRVTEIFGVCKAMRVEGLKRDVNANEITHIDDEPV